LFLDISDVIVFENLAHLKTRNIDMRINHLWENENGSTDGRFKRM